MIWSTSLQYLAAAVLIVALIEIYPITPPPADRGHPWICECRQCCE